ncbi:phospholipase effector Tle1 domain-containing protein, partial [Vibrio algivorus]
RYAESPKQGHYPDSLIYKFKASVNEAKKVRCKRVHDSFNLMSHIPVSKLYSINSNVVVDSILFFTPAMQMDERLGLATSGYFYHFHEHQLIQEFHIKGDNRCFFSPTVSTHDYLNSTQYIQKVTNTIGVYYQLGGKPATNQHVIYLPTAITHEQLDNVNEEWLLEHGMAIDVEALLAARDEAVIESDAQNQSSQSDVVKTKTHIVKSNSDTGKRETWPEIAAQYNLSARELLDFNPSYNDDPMRLAAGDSLVVSAPPQMQPQGVSITEPATTPKDYQCAANCSYEYQRPSFKTVHDARIAGSTLYPLYSQYLVEETLPVARIQTLPQRTFTIGVFFDGTGQNAKNDEYKETHGDKSRTNIARLFDAYPLTPGKTDKIYVSGVGTIDKDDGDTSFIDRGEDETSLAQALGVEMMDALASKQKWLALQPQLATVLTEAAKQKLEKTSALYKWQSLIVQLQRVIRQVKDITSYNAITHIQFDVFGFSRGAALARHFVNAALKGIPDYDKPRNGDDGLGITPNLLGIESGEVFNPTQGYEVDSSKAVSVRFVGLFDTVGSFYLPGNQGNGQFLLGLEPDCAQTVLQLTAHHEYRHNFPLTSLSTGNAPLPSNFYQEVFPGAHSDVGGGYPWQAQYNKEGLAERYGVPTNSTYNRELVKVDTQSGAYLQHDVDHQMKLLCDQRREEWNKHCLSKYQQYGLLTYEGRSIYYYRLQPISSSLSGLTQERMKQQAEIAGVDWFMPKYQLPKDFEENNEIQILSASLLAKSIGSVDAQDWMDKVLPSSKVLIHRPHDALINSGCETAIEKLINRPNQKDGNLYREVFDNV